ncbi:GNAT family N-acetyltransferase [Microbispora sp. NPDC049125]|uniref:GNAT family N-acetyltransferase n=1 Tax=Microbispora sp. NPDC049125 TaxID=3154929 RepID=UPI003466EFE8
MSLHVRLAVDDDLEAILDIRERIAAWLARRGIDQWQEPWPDEQGQRGRILAGIRKRETWLLCEGALPAATVTLVDYDAGNLWAGIEGGHEPALYVHRLMVHPGYMKHGIGAYLLWAAHVRAARRGLPCLRLDAWTTNDGLHRYYEKQKFKLKGYIPDKILESADLVGYPSAALFERRVDGIRGGVPEQVSRLGVRYGAENPYTPTQDFPTDLIVDVPVAKTLAVYGNSSQARF